MIPRPDILAWEARAPWAGAAMVEQDLALSRAVVEIFSAPELARAVALRGGTALHKIGLSPPGRYSEDIDLVQTAAGPIGALLDGLRARLDPWLGMPTRDQAAAGVTLLYRFESETPPVRRLRLKVEINTREHFTVLGYRRRPFAVASRWFAGRAEVRLYTSTSSSAQSSGRSISAGAVVTSSTSGTRCAAGGCGPHASSRRSTPTSRRKGSGGRGRSSSETSPGRRGAGPSWARSRRCWRPGSSTTRRRRWTSSALPW